MIAKNAGLPLIVDNTLATPYLCQPFSWGADIIVHSTTKFLSGHGTSMGGAIVESGKFDWLQNDKFPTMTQPDPAYHGLTFAETGMETLHLRMERHIANAQKVAEFLTNHSAVSWVSYAGLKDSPFYDLARKYMPLGAGSVFTFGLKGGYEAAINMVQKVSLFSHLANVGDTRSLILHPASTTHRQLSYEQREASGAGDNMVRLSIGLETVEDLIFDLDQALS